MLRSLRFSLASLALALSLAGQALADEVRFNDGRPAFTNVEILSETYEEVAFKVGGATQKESTSKIAEVVHSDKTGRFGSGEAKFKKGEIRTTSSREKGALDEFLSVLQEKLRDEQAWKKHYALFYIAECHRAVGDNAAALQAYQEVLADNPKSRFYAAVKLGIGEAKLAMNDKAGARAAFQELESDAKSKKLGARWLAEAASALAEIFEADGNLKEAADRFEKVRAEAAASGDKTSAGARAGIHASRLRALLDPSKSDGVITEIERALQEQWKNLDKPAENELIAAASNALGDVYAKKGDAKKALLNYLRVATDDELLAVSGEGAKALYGAAQAFEAAKGEDWKNRSDAMKRQLISRFPSSPWAKKAAG